LNLKLNIQPIDSWIKDFAKPLIIAGPCGAETEKQVLTSAIGIAQTGKVKVFRSGIWKPRTRPNSFEGVGEKGLKWLKKVKQETGLLTTVEVATAEHVRLALENEVDILWIGARTTVNPFSVQEIADVLEGIDIPVMIKNPIHPDLALWAGALERFNNAGITKLVAIHRGFYSFEKTIYRNAPNWVIPIDLKLLCPELPIICDPSHISGRTDLIQQVSQKALDLDMAGLMIETHCDPENALSDAAQQITPKVLDELLNELIYREANTESLEFENKLHELRAAIDKIDEKLLHNLSQRMQIVEKIGEYKRDNNVTILQLERWFEIIKTRTVRGELLGLEPEFINKILQLVHKESIRKQTGVMNNVAAEKS